LISAQEIIIRLIPDLASLDFGIAEGGAWVENKKDDINLDQGDLSANECELV
jgi:hypothetical protein